MKRFLPVFAALLAGATAGLAQDRPAPLLLQEPAISKDLVVFVYAGDLWTVPRGGGDARHLTTGPGTERDPAFSPDGAQIAFTGEYDGNVDVYVVPAGGGIPKRLTHHPMPDRVEGWTPDGKSILFASARNSYNPGFRRLFTVPAAGGRETELPLPMAEEGSFAPDGQRLAYVPTRRAFEAWKRYRGGTTTPVWIARLSDSSIERIPRENSNDFDPMWAGDRVFFLSDRNGPVGLYVYDTRSKRVSPVVKNEAGPDIKSASAGPGAIVYEQFGGLSILDLGSMKSRPLEIRVAGDLPAVRPHWQRVGESIRSGEISPSGLRAVFEARGEILTVPVEKGDIRNLTNTPAAAERDPSWSPDGRWIAYFSDESGEYQLHLRDQSGKGEVRKIALGDAPSFYYSPVWSPDSKKIAYTDKRLSLWYVDLDTGVSKKIDTNPYDNPFPILDPFWSPDSKWIAYTRQLKNRLAAVFLYSLDSGQSTRLTDGMSDCRYASFDRGGRYLYFTASTDIGPRTGWLDMSSFNHPVTRSVYLTVLRKEDPSPLAPESDEEKVAEAPKAAEGEANPAAEKPAAEKPAGEKPGAAKTPEVRIDLENIDQRILSLPIPPRDYVGAGPGAEGTLFLV
ncbi:MAG TPA: protease, partial [Armatimonadota bacterium]|nr:protease [Armatimonadota bacterium]